MSSNNNTTMLKTIDKGLKVNDTILPNYVESTGGYLSDHIISICQWIIFTFGCQFITVFGIGTNIVNAVCFVKQGFKDPVNISFMGLAIADLGCLITLVWSNICYTPAFAAEDLPFDTIEFQYLTSGMPHTIFTRVTGWITAMITLERCMCVVAPLKVKNVVTPRRVSVLIVCIFLILMSSSAPLYVVNRLGMKYYPIRNKTLLGLVYTGDKVNVEKISFAINNILIPFGAFSVITICTIKLVTKLHQLTKWRRISATPEQGDTVSIRNQKVAKMVVMISTLFIVCFVPISLIFMAAISVRDFAIDGKQKNMLILFGGVGFLLESINSSMNIFIYYHMSSKYRDIFHDIFCANSAFSTNSKR